MVYIPSGAYQMGENDGDVPFLHQTRPRTVSVQAFYMDQTEISNNEYRQFVDWVRDSIAREKFTMDLMMMKMLSVISITEIATSMKELLSMLITIHLIVS